MIIYMCQYCLCFLFGFDKKSDVKLCYFNKICLSCMYKMTIRNMVRKSYILAKRC